MKHLPYVLAAVAWCAPRLAAADTAYIPNAQPGGTGPGTVSVVDTTANRVVATIGVGTQPRSVAVNPLTHTVYVANEGNAPGGVSSVSVINGRTNTVVATVPVADTAFGIAAGNQRVFVGSVGSTVTEISTSTNRVVGTVTIPGGLAGVGPEPVGLALNAAGTRVYTANFIDSSVSVIDVNSPARTTSRCPATTTATAAPTLPTGRPTPAPGTSSTGAAGTPISWGSTAAGDIPVPAPSAFIRAHH